MKIIFGCIGLLLPIISAAQDHWVSLSEDSFVNVGNVTMNETGNRLSTIRSIKGNFNMDILAEFDCGKHRVRALSSSVSDNNGQVIFPTKKSTSNSWDVGENALGLEPVCSARITK